MSRISILIIILGQLVFACGCSKKTIIGDHSKRESFNLERRVIVHESGGYYINNIKGKERE